jgi:uncharacterized protein (TIGR03083 family)
METPNVVHLLPQLDEQLIALLQSLTAAEWQAQTIAKLWTVKDVAAHLLDGNIRVLSMLRDGYFGEKNTATNYEELVQFLNGLNADWVKAMKRVSPQMLILLHQITGPLYCRYYAALSPSDTSLFAVNWLGENKSTNHTHIAREYTEKWLHQQQIRDAVGKPGLMTKTFFHPFISVFMLALPYTYRNVTAAEGTVIQITITTNIGDTWFLLRTNNRWQLMQDCNQPADAQLFIEPDIAWKLFSKSIRPAQVRDKVIMCGNVELASTALNMVSVMA